MLLLLFRRLCTERKKQKQKLQCQISTKISSELKIKKCFLKTIVLAALCLEYRIVSIFKYRLDEEARPDCVGEKKNQDSELGPQVEIFRKYCHHPKLDHQIILYGIQKVGQKTGFRYNESVYLKTRCNDVILKLQSAVCLVLRQKSSLERKMPTSLAT